MLVQRRMVFATALLAIALTMLLLFLWIREAPLALAPALPNSAQSTPRVPIDEVDQWVAHLRDQGTVRVVRDGGADGGSTQEIKGLGQLQGEELAFAVSSVQKVVEQRRARLEQHYKLENWNSQEECRMREAELVSDHRYGEAFSGALEKGSYIVVETTKDKPPLPRDVAALNLGVMHRGKPVLLVVLARKKESGLDAMDAYVKQTRDVWLAMVAYAFNGKSDDERRALIERLLKNDPKDRVWRDEVFPLGLSVDTGAMLFRVGP